MDWTITSNKVISFYIKYIKLNMIIFFYVHYKVVKTNFDLYGRVDI